MKTIQTITLTLSILLLGWITVWAQKKNQAPVKTEDTYVGSISCTVTKFKVVPPKPGAVGNPATPLNPGDIAAAQAPNAVALPQLPQAPGLNQPPAPNDPNAGPAPANAAAQKPAPINGQPAKPNDPAQLGVAPNDAQNPPLIPPPPKKILNYTDCLANGGMVVIQPDGQSKNLVIDNPEIIKGHEWQRLSLSGYMKGVMFHVISVRIV